VLILRSTFYNSYTPDKIEEKIDDILSKKGTSLSNFEPPKIALFYIPFWVFEYHVGKRKGVGFLDASKSEIVLDNKAYIGGLKSEAVDLDKVLTLEEYRFYKPQIMKAKVATEQKALDFINYKLPYLFEEKERHFVTEVDLYYLPFWDITASLDKEYSYSLLACNEKTILELDSIGSGIQVISNKSSISLFSELFEEIKSPKSFFAYLGNIFLYTSKMLFDVLSWFFKGKLAGLKLLALVLVIALLIIFL
jgi:hypothetical protein